MILFIIGRFFFFFFLEEIFFQNELNFAFFHACQYTDCNLERYFVAFGDVINTNACLLRGNGHCYQIPVNLINFQWLKPGIKRDISHLIFRFDSLQDLLPFFNNSVHFFLP